MEEYDIFHVFFELGIIPVGATGHIEIQYWTSDFPWWSPSIKKCEPNWSRSHLTEVPLRANLQSRGTLKYYAFWLVSLLYFLFGEVRLCICCCKLIAFDQTLIPHHSDFCAQLYSTSTLELDPKTLLQVQCRWVLRTRQSMTSRDYPRAEAGTKASSLRAARQLTFINSVLLRTSLGGEHCRRKLL